MQLSYETLRDKIKGCWTGKNIGGVLGAPLEGKRQINNISFYTQDISGNPPPNDDLDLQLVWLNAVEKFGRNINASILGEYWLSFITPYWVEYGTGKTNLQAGILPPLSGHISNKYENSCGCFIRSELWACLSPGRPELAARYAYEDAIVDHAYEGVYAEIFCATLQSAAFVESDKYKLIDIALSYIPNDCAVRKAVDIALDSYEQGVDFIEARSRVMSAVPGNFGLQDVRIKDIKDDFPYGDPGFDAPQNIGFIIIGWLYGENDFGKSLCLAVNCGEDTDCTAATLGAIMGITMGYKDLPEKWVKPIGGIINTCCINLTTKISLPDNVDQLTDRVLRNIPSFLGNELCDILYGGDGFTVKVLKGEELNLEKGDLYIPLINGKGKPKEMQIEELLKLSPFVVLHRFPTFNLAIDYQDEPFIKINEPKKVKLIITDNGITTHQQWVHVKLYADENIIINNGKQFSAPLQNTYKYKIEIELEVIVQVFNSPKIEIIVDASILGRHTNGIAKIILFPTDKT